MQLASSTSLVAAIKALQCCHCSELELLLDCHCSELNLLITNHLLASSSALEPVLLSSLQPTSTNVAVAVAVAVAVPKK